MKNKMKFAGYTLLLILLVSCTNQHQIDKSRLSMIDNNKFKFELPPNSKESPEDFKALLQQMNDAIIYLAICDTGKTNTLLSVAKYYAEEKMTIKEAYQLSVNTKPELNSDTIKSDYKLVDAKEYQIEGKTLRYKVSESFGETNSIMFYFMKNDYSDELYEVKYTCKTEQLKAAMKVMEKVALSVSIE